MPSPTPAWILSIGGLVVLLLVHRPASAESTVTLAVVLDEVRVQSPSLAAGRARIVAARRAFDATGRPLDPMLRVELDRVGWAKMSDPAMLRYMLEQPLPTPGTLGMQERVAAHATARVEADLASLSRELELEAASAYVMLWRAERELEVVATQSKLVEDLIAAALARMSTGADTHHDVIQSQVELLALQNQQTQLRAERLRAIAMLNALRNRPAAEIASTEEPLPLPAGLELEQALESEALRNRPELIGMTAMAGEEHAMATLMRREAWPMLSVGAWYTQGLGMADSIGLMIGGTLPVFGASRQASLAAESDARAHAVEADRTAMELMIRAQIESAYARYGAASERVSLLGDTALPRAEQALLQGQSSYRTGMMAFASVVQDERMLSELRMQLIGARAERYDAYLALMRAVGRDLAGRANR